MIFVDREDSRLVKAWESASDNKDHAASCMALAPQGTFWIFTKVGDLNPAFHASLPADRLADVIAKKMKRPELIRLSFHEAADLLEKGWSQMVSHDDHGYLEPIEILLVQNKSEGLEEIERHFAAPRLLELAQ